ncbi:archease [Massilia horti]|uniref:Archease n=1 Tax=Massilia horti TaxID=2562153 RepID=A0A4Y9T262_9BURK|nr:archease [Massilia horti]TFW33576.1 archease [Massilia horti]
MLEPDHVAAWEHFPHDADIGIRGKGATCLASFEQAALGLTAIVTPLQKVRAPDAIQIACPSSGDSEFLFLEPIDLARHAPAALPRGPILSGLKVAQHADRSWRAQCVVRVS